MTLSMAGKVVSDSVVAQRAGATVPMAVVIPTFDRRELLQELLEAVDALDPAPAEVVVVSDGSSDGTDELVADLGVTLLVTPRLGPAAARNAGWRATTSDVVAFVDDDCLPDPSWLGRLWTAFSALPEVGVVQGRTRPVRPPGPYERTIDVASEYGL
ncbi:MAG TPA: glycosyltransferase family 2 protein, partial [Acidimicrobiales bacterium]|nr:glycosyltransferase family 2 protein [Acidimicrobiales bacterium]